jgi:hypothetical protein
MYEEGTLNPAADCFHGVQGMSGLQVGCVGYSWGTCAGHVHAWYQCCGMDSCALARMVTVGHR